MLVLSPATYSQESVVAPQGKPKLLSSDYKFTEGPAMDAEGNVYFTDQPNNQILKVDLDQKITVFLKPSGRSNGMFFAKDGKLIACADEKNEMWEIDAQGQHRVLFSEYQGKKLNGPNDVWVHPSGFLYFTDPFYKRPWWEHSSMPQEGQHVYRTLRDGTQMVRIADGFKQPNGIVGDSKRGLLYVADIGDRKTYVFQIEPDGNLTGRKLFCEEGSDGMTLDEEGNLYLTGKAGVTVYGPDGKKREVIAIDKNWTANVCFGGRDRKTLYVTASDSLYAVPMRVAGLEPGR
ncbi:MAG: SMP-30/gluconolactonase/LRE family protein [Pirellulales bacterium]